VHDWPLIQWYYGFRNGWAISQCTVWVLSDKTNLSRAEWFRSLSIGQNTLHSSILKRALRSSAWLWCFMFGFRFHSVTWKIFFTNEALMLALSDLPLLL